MYLHKAIAEADKLRPNTVDDEMKAAWLEQLEARLADVLQIEPPDPSWPDDKELMMPRPGDQMYVFWLCAMIDWAQLDLQMYQIDQMMFEESRKSAVAWWRRHHRPVVNPDGSRVET